MSESDLKSGESATRDVVGAEQAEINRERPGGYTFNAFPPDDYEGRALVFAVIRLGDHAHITVETARQHPNGARYPTLHHSEAGRLIFAWADWLHFRVALDAIPWVRIAEVENPTPGQLDRNAAYSIRGRAGFEDTHVA